MPESNAANVFSALPISLSSSVSSVCSVVFAVAKNPEKNDSNASNIKRLDALGVSLSGIVAGSVAGGVRTMYAALYTGPPTPDASLKVSDASVEVVDSATGPRVVVAFTRPLVGGYLNANFGSDGSILSGFADILWAVGLDSSTSDVGCNYHDNNRGMRVIDWENPEIAMVETWKC